MKPNGEQIKRFWEWCGFTKELRWSDPNDIVPRGQFAVWWYPDKHAVVQHLSNVPIDLNNLFKYAVPRFISHMSILGGSVDALQIIIEAIYSSLLYGKDSALALFWAIYKVIEGGKQ